MADIYIDTTKINECGEDLIKLSTEFIVDVKII